VLRISCVSGVWPETQLRTGTSGADAGAYAAGGWGKIGISPEVLCCRLQWNVRFVPEFRFGRQSMVAQTKAPSDEGATR